MKEWTNDEIEALTESEVKSMAIETLEVKGYNVYLVDFGGYFGFSCLIFKNNHSIYYANDYELFHRGEIKIELREIYIRHLNSILFTEDEISASLKNYSEYTCKSQFLHSYYGMQTDYVSAFYISHGKDDDEKLKQRIKGMVYNPIAFSYMTDVDFIKHHIKLWESLEKAKSETVNNYEYQKSAFLYEMDNHEFGINWEADYSVLSAFGKINYTDTEEDELETYFKQLHFTDVQRQAYLDARRQYLRKGR